MYMRSVDACRFIPVFKAANLKEFEQVGGGGGRLKVGEFGGMKR